MTTWTLPSAKAASVIHDLLQIVAQVECSSSGSVSIQEMRILLLLLGVSRHRKDPKSLSSMPFLAEALASFQALNMSSHFKTSRFKMFQIRVSLWHFALYPNQQARNKCPPKLCVGSFSSSDSNVPKLLCSQLWNIPKLHLWPLASLDCLLCMWKSGQLFALPFFSGTPSLLGAMSRLWRRRSLCFVFWYYVYMFTWICHALWSQQLTFGECHVGLP